MPDTKFKFTPPPEAPTPDEGVIHKYGPSVIRGASGFLGFNPISGAIAGGGGETLAEMLEKGTINPLNLDAKRIAAETAVGGAMGGYVKGLKIGGGMVRAAAKGALMGGSAPVIRHAVEEHKLAPLSEVGSGAVVGGATGGILEKFLGWHHNPDVTPPTKLDILQGADAFHDVTTRAPHTVDIPKKEAYVHQPPVTDSPRVAKVVANEAKTKLADATQEARAIDKRVKASDTIVKAHAGAEAEQLKRDFDAIAAQKVQNAKNTLLEQGAEWTPKTVSESSSTKVAGGKQSTSTKLKVPPPPEGEVDPTVADTLGPSDASGPDSPAPILSKPTKPSTVSGTKRFFANKKEAITAAQNRGMNVVLNDAGTYELIPFEKTVTPTSTTSTPSDKTYRTWAEARGAAKLSGGDVSGDLKSGFKVGTKSAPTTDITNQFTPEDLSKFSEHGIDQLKNGVDTPRIEAPARLQSEGEIKGAQESQAISDIIHGEDAPSIGNGTGEDSPLPPVTKVKGLKVGAKVEPPTPLTPEETHGVKWLEQEYDTFPHEKDRRARTFNGDPTIDEQINLREAGNGSHSDIEQVAGRTATRPEVKAAIQKGLNGTLKNKKEKDLFDAVRRVGSTWTKAAQEGRPIAGATVETAHTPGWDHTLEHSPMLPPEAGGDLPSSVQPAEAQPTLPGAEDVRTTENATPTFEAPFSLESEVAQSKSEQSSLIDNLMKDKLAQASAQAERGKAAIRAAKTPEEVKAAMNLKAEPPSQPRGVIPTLDKPVDEMMERQGITSGTNKAIGQPTSPPSGLVLSKKLEGEGWDRTKFGPETLPTPKVAEPPTIDPNAEADIADLQSLSPEQRKNAIAAMIKGEKGEINPVLMARLGLGLGGALTGAAVDKEDPLTGAILGGAGGAMLPSAGPMLANLASKEAPEAGGLVKALTSRINNWQRSALLSDPKSIAWNSFGGPMGSHFFGGLEQTLKGAIKGDEAQLTMGKNILSDAVNVPKWAQGYVNSLREAANIVHNADVGRAGFDAPLDPNIIDRIMKLPADWMTAGDLNVKKMLEARGVPKELAEQITLTAEPRQALTKIIANWGKTTTEGGAASKIANLMLPFKRTAANILESGIQRTPVAGEIQNFVNGFKDPQLQIPFKERLVNQGLGGAVFGVAYYAGLNTPSGTAKDWKLNSLASNLGGQYAMLSGIGFVMGQAKRLGQNPRTAFTKEAGGDIPLPTTGPLMEIISPFLKVASGEPLTKKDIPRSMYPRILTYAEKYNQPTSEEPPPSSFKFTPPE